MRYIDAFNHFFPKGLWDRMLASEGAARDIGKRMRGIPAIYDLDARLKIMDRFGDYTQVISLGMPPLEGKLPDLLVVESTNGCFGLIVDSVREVLTVSQEDFELNPSTIHERSKAFFAGTYKLKDRLMVMLDPARIDPLELARAN